MNSVLLALLCAAALSGLWVWAEWRKHPAHMRDMRAYVHAAVAALILITLVTGLDQHESGHGLRLLGIFLTIATGMLLFLKRQRQNAFPGLLLAAHVGLSLIAVGLVAWALLA